MIRQPPREPPPVDAAYSGGFCVWEFLVLLSESDLPLSSRCGNPMKVPHAEGTYIKMDLPLDTDRGYESRCREASTKPDAVLANRAMRRPIGSR